MVSQQNSNYSKCQTNLKWKNNICVYFMFQAILSIFLTNLLRGWEKLVYIYSAPTLVGLFPGSQKFSLKVTLLRRYLTFDFLSIPDIFKMKNECHTFFP